MDRQKIILLTPDNLIPCKIAGDFLFPEAHSNAAIHTSINHHYIISEMCLKITVALVFFLTSSGWYRKRCTGLHFPSLQLIASTL